MTFAWYAALGFTLLAGGWDLRWKVIPAWLTAVGLAVGITGAVVPMVWNDWIFGWVVPASSSTTFRVDWQSSMLWRWDLLGMLLFPFFAWIAGLPGGDVKALAVLGGFLGVGAFWPALVGLGVSLGLTAVVFATLGRRRSLIGVPWFFVLAAGPLIAVVILG